MKVPDILRTIADEPRLVEAARIAIEDHLIDMRDRGIGLLGRGNGLVVRYADCTPSDIIRMSTPDAIVMALKTIADKLESEAIDV